MPCRKCGNCVAGGSDGKGRVVKRRELVAQEEVGNEEGEKNIIKTVNKPPVIPDFNFEDTKQYTKT